MRAATTTIALCVALATTAAAQTPAAAPRPNLVFILADDLGYGDLASYGARDIATPNLDRLAREGVRFTSFYAVGNTCSPSRAALMTGRYPARSGVNAVLFHDTPEGLPQDEITIPELLRDAGYRTAMVGKWHLGNSDAFMPWNHGFTEFFGVPHSNDQQNFFVWDGRRRLPEDVDQSRLLRRYTDRALAFLESAVREGVPFFLYVAHNAPHIPLYPSEPFRGRSRGGTYGDVVEELDASVGELMAKLVALGVDRSTLVVFTSDNGPWLAMGDWGGSAGGLRGGKTSTFEGGHRVPAIARWPDGIPPGRTVSTVADMMDWLPTFAQLAGAPIPDDRTIDGRSLVGLLEGRGEPASGPFYYFSLRMPFRDQRPAVGAVRDGRWKLKLAQSGWYPAMLEPLARTELYSHPQMLFDLDADPGEQDDVSARHPDVVARLAGEIAAFEAGLDPAVPVRTSAAPADHTGWERLVRGVGLIAAIALGAVALVLGGLVLGIRRWRRRRRG
ncbi:MAG: sulfatase [bacterium]|nr:sulfatase [bacterium]